MSKNRSLRAPCGADGRRGWLREPAMQRVLVGAWLLLTLLLALVASWTMTPIGEGLLLPTARVCAIVLGLYCVGQCALAIIVRRGRARISRGAWLAYAIGTCVLLIAAGVFTYDVVQPLQVRLWSTRLATIVLCASGPAHQEGKCAHGASVNVPGLGSVPWSGIAGPGDGLDNGAISVGVGVGTGSDLGTRGYYYQPGSTLRTLDINALCVRHLFGPWWEFGSDTSGNCPWGGYTELPSP
jgi:hypothetical protein